VRSLLLIVGVATLVAATAATAADGEPKRAITQADEAAARSVVLRRADLGAGFVARPAGPDDLPPGVRCGALDESDLTIGGDANSPDFRLDEPGVLLTVGSSVQVYKTVADASASWARGQRPAATTCLADIVRASGGTGQRVTVVSARRIAFPKLSPKTTAFRIVANVRSGGASVKVYFDAVLLQQGRTQAGVVFTSAVQPIGLADRAALAGVVAARLAKASGRPSGPVA
jgi:hypothetical protein